MNTKAQITTADEALTLAAYAVRKAKTDPGNRNNWLKNAAAHIADATKAIKAASPAPAKKAPAKKAPAKKATR